MTRAASTSRLVPWTTALYLTVVIFGWGGNYALVKLALRDCPPFMFNALRVAGGTLVLACALALFRRRLLPVRDERLGLGLVGLCQVTLMVGLTTLGLVWIEASRSVLLAYTMPLWALAFGRLLLRERVTATMIAGALIGLAGVAMLFNPLILDWSDPHAILGSVLGLLGSIGWALGSTLYRRRRWVSEFWTQVFWQVLVGSIPLVACALLVERADMVRPTPTLLGVVFYNWLVPVALAYWCWARVLDRMPAPQAGQFIMLAPVFGTLFAMVLFDEPFRPAVLLAGALIIAGAALSLSRAERNDPAPPGRAGIG